MSYALLNSVDAEIAAIELEMANDPRIMKLETLRRLRSLYSNEPAAPIATRFVRDFRPIVDGLQRGRTMKPERAEALRLSKVYIAEHPGRPIKTAEIYTALELQGCRLPGTNPANNLSSLLIRSSGIKSHGRAGWTLETETPEAPDADQQDRSSEASNSSVLDQADNPNVRPVDPVPGGGT